MPRGSTMTRTPERFAFVVSMLCLIAAWAGFIPFDMNQVCIAYLIFWAAWSVWNLLEWRRAFVTPAAGEAPATPAALLKGLNARSVPVSKGLDLDDPAHDP
jgi:hypothetical protein